MNRSVTWGVVVSWLLAAAFVRTAVPPVPPPTSVVIEDAAVFDPGVGTMLTEWTIVIRGDRIVAVTPADASATIDVPPDANANRRSRAVRGAGSIDRATFTSFTCSTSPT